MIGFIDLFHSYITPYEKMKMRFDSKFGQQIDL